MFAMLRAMVMALTASAILVRAMMRRVGGGMRPEKTQTRMKTAVAAFGNHHSEPSSAMLMRMRGFSSVPPDASTRLVVETSRA